jgi:hypothetical protein
VRACVEVTIIFQAGLGKGEKKVKKENEEGRGHANAHVAFHSPRSVGRTCKAHTDGDSLVVSSSSSSFLWASSHKLIQPRRRNGKWRGELEFRLSLRGGVLLRVTAFVSLSCPHKKAAQVVN